MLVPALVGLMNASRARADPSIKPAEAAAMSIVFMAMLLDRFNPKTFMASSVFPAAREDG
jgi:hypothetical protein